MTSRSKQFLQRAERIMQVKEVKSKNSVMKENSELLKKSEVSVSDFIKNVHESAADKFKNNENFTLWMFNEKNKNETEVCEIQIIFHKINE